MQQDEHLAHDGIEQLIQMFGNQTLDFFGAIWADTYNNYQSLQLTLDALVLHSS